MFLIESGHEMNQYLHALGIELYWHVMLLLISTVRLYWRINNSKDRFIPLGFLKKILIVNFSGHKVRLWSSHLPQIVNLKTIMELDDATNRPIQLSKSLTL
ncbi:hypothetical protein PMIT1312_00411 [Prochlorococcus marinus str. MIT 1312]|nr:hypothetical protein PMIT1312_00411 [Prochlorococcus marinus str. MIT 1312]